MNSTTGDDRSAPASLDDLNFSLGEALTRVVINRTVVGVVVAHPGDESLLAGGLMALLASLEIPVHVLAVTRGQAGVRGHGPDQAGRVREAELRQACRVLGAASVTALEHMDLAVVADPALEGEIAAWATKLGVTLLITHHPDDPHRDGRAVSAAVLNTEAVFPRPPLIAYADAAKASAGRPDIVLDVTWWDRMKMEALLAHTTQGEQLMCNARVLSQHRGIGMGIPCSEAFTGAGARSDATVKRLVLLEFAAKARS